MNIVFAMILSVAIKAVSAVVEIAIQMLITNSAGVNEYGSYTYFVSLIEGGYFFLFSGSVKLNSFYLSTPDASIQCFKRKFNCLYVFPIVAAIIVLFCIMKNPLGIMAAFSLLIFYFAYDTSSTFFSRGYQLPALLGEYLFGRIALLIGILAVIKLNLINSLVLLVLYTVQFATMLLWFVPFKKKLKQGTNEIDVPMRKIVEYQLSDVATSLITYLPTILQYIIGGAFTAGFTGIVSLVKKFINFISGPTAKVFLPEFSRLYKSGEKARLEQSYLMIVRIQMIFIGTIGAVLIGFPNLILHMFSPDLEKYSVVFTGTAVTLLIVAGIGPVTGMLQMTGNEKICNRNQWISIAIMILVCLLFNKKPLFAVYGLCAQAITEGSMKYYSVCKWFGKNVVPVKNYALLWLPVAILRIAVDHTGYQYSYIVLLISAMLVLLWNTLFALHDPMVKTALLGKFAKK